MDQEQETKDRKVLWIDVETTGTDPEKNAIVQIAGLVEINGAVVEEFDLRVKPLPEDQIEFGAIEATGLDLLEVISYPDGIDTLKAFVAILDKYINKFDKEDKFHPAGYSVKFDIDFLWQFCIKQEFKYFRSYVDHITIDVYGLVKYLIGIGDLELNSLKLRDVCYAFGIEIDAHDAMSDIVATRQLGLKLQEQFLIQEDE